jgi:hypothetical protein
MEAPKISEGLLAYLAEAFPDRMPSAECNIDEFNRLVGQQEVVRHLRHKHNEQNPLTETPDG